MEKNGKYFPSKNRGVVIKWDLHPNMMTMVIDKMGIVATNGGVHILTAMKNKKDFICCCLTSVNEPLIILLHFLFLHLYHNSNAF